MSRKIWLLAAIALLGACGEGASPLDDPELDGANRDAQPLPTRDAALDGGSAGLFGAPCTQNRQCASNFCIEAPEGGRICTKLCGDCPEGFECAPITNTGPDTTFVCIYDRPELCKPCALDRDCDDAADLCLQLGNGRYCGEDCRQDGTCPDGYTCAELTVNGELVKQCIPSTGACAPCHDEDGDGYGDGADCLGFDCNDGDPFVFAGAPERCDGKDNNCNSLADEDENLEPPPTDLSCLSDGVCRGTEPACFEGAWGCPYPSDVYESGVEASCDGLDNDCDGQRDDDFDLATDQANCGFCQNACVFAQAASVCINGGCELGPCNQGWHNIDRNDGNGCEYACNLTRDGIEVCDEVDNDCDGLVDEGFDLSEDPENCGECGQRCAIVEGVGACRDSLCLIDHCNSGFHDLDGQIANGCEYACNSTGAEICDGLDNDCDGEIDEDYDLETSLEHCGRCNNPCEYPQALAICAEGRCRLDSCVPGYFNANNVPQDGCEYACIVSREGIEACDGLDNDCDRDIDEDYDFAHDPQHCGGCGQACFFANAVPTCLGAACAIGPCVANFHNIDGDPRNGCEYACIVSGAELCNQADDNCDGAIDEAFDLQRDVAHCGRCNRACETPNGTPRCAAGECRISECDLGFHDLDGVAANGCEYGCQRTAGGIEACDRIDNDCDGLVDEDFDFQTDLLHCGGCNQPCEAEQGQLACRQGGCVLTGCEEGFHDLDGDASNGCEYRCDYISAVDLPDRLAIDANCDGIDGVIANAVFVAANGRSAGLGTPADPVNTIQGGITRAAETGRTQVYVASGGYDESVSVVPGVSLFGGYSRSNQWSRDLNAFETRINGRPIALRAEGLQVETRVQGFTLVGANATTPGESTYAVYARDVARNALWLDANIIQAGNGADGASGRTGQRGTSGEAGSQGSPGTEDLSSGGFGGGGGGGCKAGGSGGRGGYDGNSTGGSAGGGNGGGADLGGLGGAAVSTGCDIQGGAAAAPGAAGGPRGGGIGTHGRGGDGTGAVIDDFWSGSSGAAGSVGVPGEGGGGGGGGGGTTACTSCGVPCNIGVCVCRADRGGGGGGGGGGGCGGTGGTGGAAGGGSFGVFLVRASARFTWNTISGGAGGDGGAGGNGGPGGTGGSGAAGGEGPEDSGAGGRGASGGNGGLGGHGGGGSGGVSFALYSASSTPTVDATNSLQAGQGGLGGNSPSGDNNDGQPGVAMPRN